MFRNCGWFGHLSSLTCLQVVCCFSGHVWHMSKSLPRSLWSLQNSTSFLTRLSPSFLPVFAKGRPSGKSTQRRPLRSGALHPTYFFARRPNLRLKIAQSNQKKLFWTPFVTMTELEAQQYTNLKPLTPSLKWYILLSFQLMVEIFGGLYRFVLWRALDWFIWPALAGFPPASRICSLR